MILLNNTNLHNSEKLILIRVTTSYYCAGIVVRDNKIISAANILKWTIGRNYLEIIYLLKEKYKAQIEFIEVD